MLINQPLSQKIMTFQKLIVNAVDIVDGMDALAIREILCFWQ